MKVQLEHPADEIKRLQRCINDLVSLLALPALSTRRPPRRSGSLNRKNRCSDRESSVRSSIAGREMTHKNLISRNAVTLETKRFHSCPGLSGFSVKSG